MNSIINEFEDLPAVVANIELLDYEARRSTSKKEKIAKLREAQRLADAYEEHCSSNGNHTSQFKKFI